MKYSFRVSEMVEKKSLPVQHKGSRILIVDDENYISAVVSRWLREEGYECATATSAMEALGILEESSHDLLISDIMMPDISGIQLLKTVKERWPDLAVIMATGVDSREVAIRCLQVGAFGYMIKPFEKNELLINVANALERRSLVTQSRQYESRLEREIAARTEELRQKNRELEEACAGLKGSQTQLVQQEKLAAIGLLAAGIAHEINTPVGYIASNLRAMEKYVDGLLRILAAYENLLEGKKEAGGEMEQLKKDLRIEHIKGDILNLVAESLDGAERIKEIVQDLRCFARADREEMEPADIKSLVDGTLNIAWNELKYKATVEKQYGDLPPVRCYPRKLSQVVLNLLVNAAQAIEDKGEVRIRTWMENGRAFISVADTGRGIPRETLEEIFEPFYTTKKAGEGTGLGLSISRNIVREHGGEITVESEVGRGSTFTIGIPAGG